jgi:glycosyltransferase involved in cell wall biosynthesis
MKIAFHSNHLGILGTETALYDYAHFNEEYLGNQSIIIGGDSSYNNKLGHEKFRARFNKVYSYITFNNVQSILDKEHVDYLYVIKAGCIDNIISYITPTLVHAVYTFNQPHGHRYAYVSEWLSKFSSNGAFPYVPHMINLPNIDKSINMRAELNIPISANVFGRHGTEVGMDVSGVCETIYDIAKKYKDIYFVFINKPAGFNKLVQKNKLPNLIFLPANVDLVYKAKFINTCDAMIHASGEGETFGIAVGEFSICNKPVITWTGGRGCAHREILGDTGIYYNNSEELRDIILNFKPNTSRNYDMYSEKYNPVTVMNKFKEVFLS